MKTPFLYVKQYHNVWTPVFVPWVTPSGFYGIAPVQTPVKEYCNSRYTNKAGKTPSERLKFKDDLLGFFRQRSKEADSGIVYSKGDGYSLSSSVTVKPVFDLPKSAFIAGVNGKAGPETLAGVIQFIAYWHRYQTVVEKRNIAPIPTIVSTYLGADCNGFVGNYLQSKYKGCTLGPSNTEKTYHSRGKGNRRNKPSEIRMDDVIVRGDFGHVILVQEVIDFGDDWAVIEICESRSKNYGGPQWSIEEINLKKDKKGKVVPGEWTMRGEDWASISEVRYV